MSGIGLVAITASAVFLIGAIALPDMRALLTWLAWGSFVLVILCMETRVRMGYRLPRKRLFMSHMMTAVPGLILLTANLFFTVPSYVFPLAAAFLFAGIVSGALLFHQGWQRYGSTSASPDSKA